VVLLVMNRPVLADMMTGRACAVTHPSDMAAHTPAMAHVSSRFPVRYFARYDETVDPRRSKRHGPS